MTVLVQCDRLGKQHRPRRALTDVSLSMTRGERIAIIGPSGAGKSSLARIMAGIERPDTGTVHYDGQDLFALPPRLRARKVQLVLQDAASALDSRMRVGALIAEPFVIHAQAFDEAILRAQAARVGLAAEHLDRYPHQLSGGEKQRVQLARALALSPELLILDEPITHLDAIARTELIATIATLAERDGTACLVITHDLTAVRRFAARVLVMADGRIVETGDVESIRMEPKDLHTRALVESTAALERAWALAAGRERA